MVNSCPILARDDVQGLDCERSGAVVALALKAAIDGENSVVTVAGDIIDDVGGVPTIPGVTDLPNLIVFVSEVDGFNVAIVTGDTIDGVGGIPRTPENRYGSGLIISLVLKTGGLDTEPLISDSD